ncbi:MAG: sulfatase-like hydrolase/transferase [Pirellulaceae bacterium]|jgi:arylsulfatase|nr:sulfatase-like hydrolase/transferase [Pirellulaceae bacterium]
MPIRSASRRTRILVASLLAPLWWAAAAPTGAIAKDGPPNVLLIMADDLGFSDLGCYGGEIETPNLNQLAADGLRFTQFYNTARCWPTRGALLTGYYAQQIRRDQVPGVPSGGRGVRPAWAPLLPAMLKPYGYRSYHSGKWHLDGKPLATGFDRSYYLRDQGRFFYPQVHHEDDRPLPPVSRVADFDKLADSPLRPYLHEELRDETDSGYYATTAIADHAVRCLQDHADKHSDRPFFHYLAFTAPHFPLHALPSDIARYRERYEEGWDRVRRRRWRRIREMQIVAGELSEPESEIGPPYHFPDALAKLGSGEVNRPLPWSELTDEQRRFQADKMAIHAAMIDRMDQEIGRVLDQLKEMGAFDNTLIFFLSDNGASAEIMVRTDGHDRKAPRGSGPSYLCLGPGWSTCSNTPFRRHKTWVHEGGCATPLIAHWPAGIEDRGKLRRNVGHVVDIVPTVIDIVREKSDPDDKPIPVDPPRPGRSLSSVLNNDLSAPRESLWWLHEGNRAIRVGDWKLVAGDTEEWQLFDLSRDRAETNDLAKEHPERAKSLATRWTAEHEKYVALAKRDAGQLKGPTGARREPPKKNLILPGETFWLGDRPAFVFLPPKEKRRSPQPWIMYGPTLPAYPDMAEKWMHQQFLDAGVAVAGVDVGEAYGSPRSQAAFDALYRRLTKQRNFAAKPVMLGRSRGGLWVSSWAVRNTDKVAAIAGIYPVYDLTTYPGLKRAAPAYQLTPKQLEAALDKHNPIRQAASLAKAAVPVCIIHGDRDKVVPLKQNSAELLRIYRQHGAEEHFQLIVAAGQGHSFWEGFFHCQELVDFAVEHATE